MSFFPLQSQHFLSLTLDACQITALITGRAPQVVPSMGGLGQLACARKLAYPQQRGMCLEQRFSTVQQ